jgi:hypothetical protein
MKKILTSFLVIAAFNCAAVSATAAANFFSQNDQTLAFNSPVSFEYTNFNHRITLSGNSQTIEFEHRGFYSINYSVVGSLPEGAGPWSVGLYHNGNLVSVAGSAGLAGNFLHAGSSIIICVFKGDTLELRAIASAGVKLSGSVSGNENLRSTSANISIIKFREPHGLYPGHE